MTIIGNNDFPDPATINSMDCLSASRYLHTVDESVDIFQVCQDSNTPSLVIISFTLIGSFLYTPVCKILSVDGDTSYGFNGTIAPIAIGHYRNSEIPLDTNCATYHPEVVFDFGKVIPNFMSAVSIIFQIQMIGTITQSFGVNYTSQNPSLEYTWQKGRLPSPIGIDYNGENLQIYFQYLGGEECSCNLQCLTQSGISQDIKFCQNDIQSISITHTLSGDPYTISLSLRDSIGNTSIINATTVLEVDPYPPIAISLTNPNRNEITTHPASINGVILDDVDYQILRYIGDDNNIKVWKDWSERPVGSLIDRDILPDTTYGYAVRYRGKFGDISNISDWTIVNR